MINSRKILETIKMINEENLDIRTITMGISLLDCASSDVKNACDRIYDKICKKAEKLVETGNDIEKEFGIPIIHKRISVTPISLVAAPCRTNDLVPFARTLQKAADTCGVNFIGGFCSERLYRQRPCSYKFASRSSCRYRKRLFFGKCRLDKSRNKYECRRAYGA